MYTREELIGLCEKAIVPIKDWRDRDTAGAQEGIGKLWVFLKAGCKFTVWTEENTKKDDDCVSNEDMIWLDVIYPGFMAFDADAPDQSELIYLPTQKKLDECQGRDWY